MPTRKANPTTCTSIRPRPTEFRIAVLSYQGSWNDGSAFHFTNSVGATVECKFQGTGVRWLGFRFDDAGKAEVSIDGKVVATVDQYGPGRDLPFEWSQKNLNRGTHSIRLRLLAEKPPQSKDRFINVAGFEAIHDASPDWCRQS